MRPSQKEGEFIIWDRLGSSDTAARWVTSCSSTRHSISWRSLSLGGSSSSNHSDTNTSWFYILTPCSFKKLSCFSRCSIFANESVNFWECSANITWATWSWAPKSDFACSNFFHSLSPWKQFSYFWPWQVQEEHFWFWGSIRMIIHWRPFQRQKAQGLLTGLPRSSMQSAWDPYSWWWFRGITRKRKHDKREKRENLPGSAAPLWLLRMKAQKRGR